MADYEFPSLSYADTELLNELAPRITDIHEHHLEVAKNWRPSDLIRKVETARLEGAFDPQQNPWSLSALSSATLGLETEEGLPYYFKTIVDDVPKDHPFALWGYRWTGEENKHGTAIYGALMACGAIDMAKLDDDILIMLTKANTPNPESFAETLVYPAPQERATRLSHIGTARLLPPEYKSVKNVFTTVASDENLHFNAYRDFTSAGIEVNPSVMMIAIARQFTAFAMPGEGIPNYVRHAVRVSNSGIYGYPEQEEIFQSLLETWGVYNLTNLSSDAEYARDALYKYMTKLHTDAAYITQRRADKNSREAKHNQSETVQSKETLN